MDYWSRCTREHCERVVELFAGGAPRGQREQAIESLLYANKGRVTRYLVYDALNKFKQGRLNTVFFHGLRGISDEAARKAISDWLVSTAPPGEAKR